MAHDMHLLTLVLDFFPCKLGYLDLQFPCNLVLASSVLSNLDLDLSHHKNLEILDMHHNLHMQQDLGYLTTVGSSHSFVGPSNHLKWSITSKRLLWQDVLCISN